MALQGFGRCVGNLAAAVVEQGKWLKEHASPDDTLATPMAGALAYYSGLRTYDMLGLTDAHIAHVNMPEMGRFYLAGHEKYDPVYILSKRPTYVWVSPDNVWIPGTRELLELPAFAEIYEVFQVPLRDGTIEVFRSRERKP